MNEKTKQLLKLEKCNLILTDEPRNLIVGIFYEKGRGPAPYVTLKEDSPVFCHFITKAAKALEICVVEDSNLVKDLFENVDEQDYIPEEYYHSLAVILARVFTLKKQTDFERELFNDIKKKYYISEKKTFIRIHKKWSKNQNQVLSDQKKDNSISLKDSLQQLAKTKKLEFKESYVSSLNMHTFAFEHYDDNKENLDFWIMVMEDSNGKISVGNQYIFQEFDADKANSALELVNTIIGEKGVSIKTRKVYFKDFSISPTLYDIATNSMKSMLEINYQQKRIEFTNANDRAIATVYLHKRSSRKMYVIVISYKEFMRNPKAFEKLIAYPHKKNKWNFWCHEEKYRKELFSK